jgi:hypothetical protein
MVAIPWDPHCGNKKPQPYLLKIISLTLRMFFLYCSFNYDYFTYVVIKHTVACPCTFILNNSVRCWWILMNLSRRIFPLEDTTLVACSFNLLVSEMLCFLRSNFLGQDRHYSLSCRILKRIYNTSEGNIHSLFSLLLCRMSNNTSSITSLQNIAKYLAFCLFQILVTNELLENKCKIFLWRLTINSVANIFVC